MPKEAAKANDSGLLGWMFQDEFLGDLEKYLQQSNVTSFRYHFADADSLSGISNVLEKLASLNIAHKYQEVYLDQAWSEEVLDPSLVSSLLLGLVKLPVLKNITKVRISIRKVKQVQDENSFKEVVAGVLGNWKNVELLEWSLNGSPSTPQAIDLIEGWQETLQSVKFAVFPDSKATITRKIVPALLLCKKLKTLDLGGQGLKKADIKKLEEAVENGMLSADLKIEI